VQAPTAAQRDDLIRILSGCSVPIVLHEHTNKWTREEADAVVGGGSYFDLIGECYIYAMMDRYWKLTIVSKQKPS
jgi:hypothetical protein